MRELARLMFAGEGLLRRASFNGSRLPRIVRSNSMPMCAKFVIELQCGNET